MTQAMREFVIGVQERFVSTMRQVLPLTPPLALVDVPNHSNVGDSAIYLGELAWLKQAGLPKPAYVCDVHSYRESDLRARVPRGTILIHGGGNLGDLWPQHQAFREEILSTFPDHRIVQLPQTIHFESAEGYERAEQLFSRHRDLTVLVRDRVSLELAESRLHCRAIECPDAAFALGPLKRPTSPSEDVVVLARTDKEASGPSPFDGAARVDWLGDPPTTAIRVERWLRVRNTGLPARQLLRRPLARQRLQRGCRLLSRGRVAVVDRLHGHILCLSMGIPHVLVDNSYGKVRAFFEAWTKDAPGVRFCREWSDAPAALAALRDTVTAAQEYA